MRRSQDIQSYINGRELNSMSSVASPSEYDRRNLKTADRDARSPELESALLHKDIVYKGSSIGRGSVAGANTSLMEGRKGRIGKSTDANAFRRSLVINQGVLQEQREGSSPTIGRHANQTSVDVSRTKDDETVIHDMQGTYEDSP